MNIQLDQHVPLWRSLTPRGRPSNSGAEFLSNTLCFCVTFVYDQLAARTWRTLPGTTIYSCNSSVATLGGSAEEERAGEWEEASVEGLD